MRPRSLTLPILALATLSACGARESGPVAQRAILITCDTLRADRLGLYGYPGGTSPQLDRFAQGALVFDRAYAATSLTLPSLASLMTGRLPDELGMISNQVVVPAEVTTIAETAQAAGFATAAVVSNWVLRRQDTGAGGIQQGFDHYDDRMESTEANRSKVKERLADATTDAALAWLDAAAGTERFFLWVHYQDPHGPYTPPAEFLPAADHSSPGDEPALRLGQTQRGFGELPSYQALGSERRPAVYRAWYDAEIRFFDRELGRLLDGIEERGLIEDALVLFSADHGESLGEHDYWFSHGQTLYRELVHVPLVIRYPDGAPRPASVERDGYRRVDDLVGHVDLPDTILAALGLAPPPTHGVSLVASELPEGRLMPQHLRGPRAPNRWTGLTDGRWRLLEGPDELLLFDLESDPGETTNLVAREPERFRAMRARYELLQRALPPLRGGKGEERELSQEELETLEALGYAGDEH